MEQDQSSSLFGMQADNVMQSRLTTISGWAKFIAIVGIIFVALAAIIFTAVGQTLFDKIAELMGYRKNVTGVIIGVIVFFVIFAFLWFYLLLRASSLIRQGIKTRNDEQLAEGFKMLRIYFVLSVIVTVCSFLITIAGMINF